jgi:hypothetical protein
MTATPGACSRPVAGTAKMAFAKRLASCTTATANVDQAIRYCARPLLFFSFSVLLKLGS